LKQRKLHIDLAPPLPAEPVFGPVLLLLDVSDDMRIVVGPASAPAPGAPGPGTSELRAIARFEVELPHEHGLPG